MLRTSIILAMHREKLAVPNRLYKDEKGSIYKGNHDGTVQLMSAKDTELAHLIKTLLNEAENSSIDTLEDVRARDNVVAGDIDLGGNRVVGAADPINPQDYVTLNYAQSLITNTSNHQLFTSGESIGAYQVVSLINGIIYRFDLSNLSHYGKCIGISTISGSVGAQIDVQMGGLIVNTGWGLVANKAYFAGTAGSLSSTSPGSGISQPIGVSGDTNSIVINISRPIVKVA